MSAMLWFSVSVTVATINAWLMASAAALLVEGTVLAVDFLDLHRCALVVRSVVRAAGIASSASIVIEVGRYLGAGPSFL